MAAVLLLSLLSGLAALVLEAVVLRQFTWLLGSAVTAASIVLCAFLGGMAAGAASIGRIADRSPRPLRLYGLLEIAIGISAAAVVLLLGPGRPLLIPLLRWAGAGPAGEVASVGIALVLLAVPTFLIGATFPPLVRLVSNERVAGSGRIGLLYAVNTLGGAAGVLLAGFVLFERIGILRAGYVAAAIDLGVGACALILARRREALDHSGSATRPALPATHRARERSTASRAARAARANDPPSQVSVTAALACAAVGGFAALGYEVIWTRLLALPLRSYAYSFSLMLALFLLGIVLGGLAASLAARSSFRPASVLGWAQLAAGLSVGASLLWLPALLAGPVTGGGLGPFLANAVLRAAPIVLIPTLLCGIALPLAIDVRIGALGAPGRSAGIVYALNTLGAVLGALATRFLLLPLLGAPRSLAALAAVHAASGALMILTVEPRARARLAVWPLAAASLVPFALPPERFVRAFLETTRDRGRIAELLFFHEGASDTIAIVKKAYGFHDPEAKTLLTNAISMSATARPVRRYMAAEGHIPVLLAAEARSAAVLCIGTGITLGAVASHPGIASVDAVDLSEGVIRGLPLFAAENDRAYESPKVRIVREDGRHFLELSRASYDVITIEPPPPIVAGSAHLYALDFYRICRERLAPGGVVAQWLPLHSQSLASARMAARTFCTAFPYAQLWLPSARDGVLVGSPRPLSLDLHRLRAAYETPASKGNLARAFLETPEALLGTFFLDRDGLLRWAGDGPLLTDDRPWMEFYRLQGRSMRDADIATLAAITPGSWQWAPALGEEPTTERAVAAEGLALRRYLDSVISQVPGSAVEAARLSRGTEFFLSTLGCASEQLRALAADPSRAAVPPGHLERCAALRAPGDTVDASIAP